MKNLYLILLLFIFLSGCRKDEDNVDELSSDPAIRFISLTPIEVINFKNSITLAIGYKDNNGDLGFDDPDEYALWVKDSRLDSADWYHVQPLAPIGKNLIIEGQLDIVLNSMFIIGNGNKELVSLSIKIIDREDHWSNIIHTPPITILKQQ